jgi:hypothetical protein
VTIHDPASRGRELARLHRELAPQLFAQLEESGLADELADDDARRRARREWDCFALYACVRGLVAAGGFNRETAAAIDALHETALADFAAEARGGETESDRRRLISERYEEYGAIGQAGGKSGAATVTARLGAAAAKRMMGEEALSARWAETVGHLHETLAEGAADQVRRAEET